VDTTLSLVALCISFVSLAVATFFAIRGERRFRRIDLPLLTAELPAPPSVDEYCRHDWADAPRAISLRWAHRALAAEDVLVLQRLKQRVWLCRLGPLGKDSSSSPLVAGQWQEADSATLRALNLPDRPFLRVIATPTHPVDGDSAVGVHWRCAGGSHWWGRAMEELGAGWRWAGDPVSSPRP
jgi:hypothetical protein